MMVNEVELAGIPAVHLTAMTPISKSLGVNRIVKGVAIQHPFCDPAESESVQKLQRIRLVERCLQVLETVM